MVAVPALGVLVPDRWRDYALIDSGDGRKLERYGDIRVVRPEPQALWRPRRPETDWAADATFKGSEAEAEDAGRWSQAGTVPEAWPIAYDDLTLMARLTPFRHLGLFPEQAVHWDFASDLIGAAGREVKVLNLFAYTGAASLVCAAAGARVTHLDASRKSVGFARENQEASGLGGRPIRWIVDDALKFLKREERRASRYDAVILDPPKYGRGPKGEVWDIFRDLPEALALVRAVLSDRPLFVVLTVYAIRASALAMDQVMREAVAGLGGAVESGEMAVREEVGPSGEPGRLVPTALFSRWRGECVDVLNGAGPGDGKR